MVTTIFNQLPSVSEKCSFEQSKFVIQQCLDHHAVEDAIFLAEMLYRRVNNDDTLILYCNCLLFASRNEEVYNLLLHLPKSNARLRYLFAKSCFDLDRIDECENALVDDERLPAQLHRIFEGTTSASFAGSLLAIVFSQTGRVKLSRDECTNSLKRNPFVWSTICKYVQVGGEHTKSLVSNASSEDDIKPASQKTTKKSTHSVKKTPKVTSPPVPKMEAPKKRGKIDQILPETRRSTRLFNNQDTENAVLRKDLKGSTPRGNKSQNLRAVAKTIEKSIEAPLLGRRSRGTKPLASRSANAMSSLSSSTTSVASSTSQPAETVKDTDSMEDDTIKQLETSLSDLYISIQQYSSIEEAISKNRFEIASEKIRDLDPKLSKEPLAVLMKARVTLELGDYDSAKTLLISLRDAVPHKVEGAELLSTAMWQLQDSNGLSALARSLTERHRRRPQTWCAVGNCFSLQRQHAQAVDCMERAVQLDPKFAYAWTLLGHELLYQDELDKAAKAFRNALNISPFDYRGWYGIGQVHQRNEQMKLAKANICKALELNPTNRGMLCTLSQVEQHLGDGPEAMRLIKLALTINPDDVACKFNYARLLFEQRKNPECLVELNELKVLSPEEPNVYHLLGKVSRRFKLTNQALLYFAWGTDMDPQGQQANHPGIHDNTSESSEQSEEEEDEDEDDE